MSALFCDPTGVERSRSGERPKHNMRAKGQQSPAGDAKIEIEQSVPRFDRWDVLDEHNSSASHIASLPHGGIATRAAALCPPTGIERLNNVAVNWALVPISDIRLNSNTGGRA